jgi:2,4-dienoyl-CoA reductase-like NADH-dependent reductase (Old Yellow Enzyme family)
MDNIHNVFREGRLAGRRVRNRLAAQAMEINSAEPGGCVSEEIIARYNSLAKGGWGMVFVEAISVTPGSLARKNGLVMSKANLDGFRRLAGIYKKTDPEGILMFQLSHAGRFAGDFSKRVKVYEDDVEGAHLLEETELDEIRDMFIEAAILSGDAGADGVDIKACHGYLGGELLRPANTRPDKYGGTAKNRSRLLCDTIREVKRARPDLVVGTRISFYEGIRGGCGTSSPGEVIEDLDDLLSMIRLVVEAGADYINVSAGIPAVTPQLTRPGSDVMFNLYHHFSYSKTVKEHFPQVAVIGSAYSTAMQAAPGFAGENISKGYVDFAGFGRQNLADPLFPARLADDPDNVKWCKLCGGCSKLLKAQKQVCCTAYNK